MDRLVGGVVAAASVLVLVGCGSQHPDAVPVTPDAVGTVVDCTAEWDVGWGRIPDGFEPVEVWVCDPLLALEPPVDGNGEPVGEPVSTEPRRLEGDLAPLIAAFGEQNDPPWPGPCTAIGVIVPDVWLVDAEGRAIRPAYPSTGCGIPKEGVSEALSLLTPAP